MSKLDKYLDRAQEAVEQSDRAGGNEQETRELRTAVSMLIKAVRKGTK